MERKTPEEMFGEVFVDLGLTPEQKAGARMNPPEYLEGGDPLSLTDFGEVVEPPTDAR